MLGNSLRIILFEGYRGFKPVLFSQCPEGCFLSWTSPEESWRSKKEVVVWLCRGVLSLLLTWRDSESTRSSLSSCLSPLPSIFHSVRYLASSIRGRFRVYTSLFLCVRITPVDVCLALRSQPMWTGADMQYVCRHAYVAV